jgi:hypothetical protein
MINYCHFCESNRKRAEQAECIIKYLEKNDLAPCKKKESFDFGFFIFIIFALGGVYFWINLILSFLCKTALQQQ